MEYCCGGSGRDCMRLRRNPGPLDERQIAVVCYQVVEALHFLDSKKLIHRDVKAVNIMVDGEGHVKLSDFGESYIKEYTMDLALENPPTFHVKQEQLLTRLRQFTPEPPKLP